MARFVDKILADPITHEDFRQKIKEAVVISGDNVAEYMFNVEGDRDYDVGRDFPNIAPPYETFWLDFKAPRYIRDPHTGERRDWPQELPAEWGFLCRTVERRKGVWLDRNDPQEVKDYLRLLREQINEITPQMVAILAKFNRELAAKGSPQRLELLNLLQQPWLDLMDDLDFNTAVRYRFLHYEKSAIEERDFDWIERQYADVAQSRWIIELALFQSNNTRGPHVLPMSYDYLWTWQFYINDDGSVPKAREEERLKGSLGAYAFHYNPSDVLRNSLVRAAKQNRDINIAAILADIERGIQPMLWSALMTITFMHAKGVEMTPVEQPDVPVKKSVARKIGSKTRKLVRYHVLEIEPLKEILRVVGQANKTGIRMALHTCRGHFKTFQGGRGLFGKHKGTYFWMPQLRGNKDLGMVVKDYEVEQPRVTIPS